MAITKLISYHANPSYHVGHEAENIAVANKLSLQTISHAQTYTEYLELCRAYCVEPYNEEVFNDHLAGKPYKA